MENWCVTILIQCFHTVFLLNIQGSKKFESTFQHSFILNITYTINWHYVPPKNVMKMSKKDKFVRKVGMKFHHTKKNRNPFLVTKILLCK